MTRKIIAVLIFLACGAIGDVLIVLLFHSNSLSFLFGVPVGVISGLIALNWYEWGSL